MNKINKEDLEEVKMIYDDFCEYINKAIESKSKDKVIRIDYKMKSGSITMELKKLKNEQD